MNSVMAIILNYNTVEDSKKCALLLKKQKGCDLKIIIVDNASLEAHLSDLEIFCKNEDIELIKSKTNNGYSAGNNIGLRYADDLGYDYAMIINPDVEVNNEYYIKECIDVMARDNQIAVLGTDIINLEGNHQNPMRELSYLEEILWPIELIRNKLTRKLPYIGNYLKSGYCQKLSGCCFIARMNFIKQIGYLDEKVFLYCEEPILAAMVRNSGMKQYYLHSVTAYHLHKSSEKGNPLKRLNIFYQSRKYYLVKYSGYKGLFLKFALFSRKSQNIIFTRRKH